MFTKLWFELRIVFINFQILSDTFKSLVALSTRLKQNQQQLFSSAILIKHNQSENNVKRINTGQQSKKSKNEEVSVSNQHKSWINNKSKKNIICYQCNKKGHYKSQYLKLIKKQPKNANQTSVGKMCVKEKNQCPQKFLQVQSEGQ